MCANSRALKFLALVKRTLITKAMMWATKEDYQTWMLVGHIATPSLRPSSSATGPRTTRRLFASARDLMPDERNKVAGFLVHSSDFD